MPVQKPQETRVRSLGQEYLLEEEATIHSSLLAGITPWTEEPGGLQSTRVAELDMTEVTEHAYTIYIQ